MNGGVEFQPLLLTLSFSCSSCVGANPDFQCTWCLPTSTCAHSTESECSGKRILYRTTINSNVDKCPRIEAAEGAPAQILLPSGTQPNILFRLQSLPVSEVILHYLTCLLPVPVMFAS